MDTAEQAGKNLQRDISARIRASRQDRGWSLEKLAEKSGLSKGYLSLIENCEKNPTITTLSKIAFSLHVQIGYLITGQEKAEEGGSHSLVRANNREVINNPYAPPEYRYESLIDNKFDRLLDAYVITISEEMPKESRQHEGEEMLFILEGNQELIYDGETMILEPGDCIYIDSSKPHNARSLDGKGRPGKCLLVIPRSNR